MKTLLVMILLFASCKKDDSITCVTCDVNVKYQSEGQPQQFYLQSSTEYCDDGWENVAQGTVYSNGTNQGNWWKKWVTTTCYE